MFIKSKHELYCFFLFCLKAFRKKQENKTDGKISHSTVSVGKDSPGSRRAELRTSLGSTGKLWERRS